MRVAVLGLGAMGRAAAARLLEKGHEVTVWNRSAGRAPALVEAGAVEAGSPRAAAEGADAVLVIVADDAAVRSVCLGADGALAGLGDAAILAQISTVSPDLMREIAAAGPEGRVVESPVMGGPRAFETGQVRFLLAGSADTVSRFARLWDDLGTDRVYCGPIGTALVLKLVQNMMLVVGVTALAEAVATGRAHGLPDDLLRAAFQDSAVVSPASRLRLDAVLDDQHPGWFTPELARKDLNLAAALAEQGAVRAALGPAAVGLLDDVIRDGRRWPDFAAVIEALGR